MDNFPLVYICVLNWNGYRDTKECLESLKKITYPNFKILVIDNGSTDNSVELLRKQCTDIEILENKKNLGFAEGNNRGIDYAISKGVDYILLLNNDTICDKDFLNRLVSLAETDKKIGIAGPKIYYYGSKRIWFAGGKVIFPIANTFHIGHRLKDRKKFTGVIEEDYQTGCAILIKRQVVERLGNLDSVYRMYFEDVDYCMRARKTGYKVICIQNAYIWHKVSAGSGDAFSEKKILEKVRSGKIFFKRYKLLNYKF